MDNSEHAHAMGDEWRVYVKMKGQSICVAIYLLKNKTDCMVITVLVLLM